MNKNFYVTSPIYYVNDVPHIGHAYTSIACDIVARFKRLQNNNVFFLTGTDEHGQKVEKSATLRGKNPQEFCDEVSAKFRELAETINLSNDDFIRTTEERHKKSAQEFWSILEKNGYIYKGTYEGWYAVRDEAFYAEDELVDGKAPTGAEVSWHKEDSYFFKLSAFQEKLLTLYEAAPDFIAPQSRFNEIVSFVKGGLKDLSISRTSFKWGIAVPQNCSKEFEEMARRKEASTVNVSNIRADAQPTQQQSQNSNSTEQSHVMYVWLDALTNYLSAIDFPNQNSAKFQQFWNNTEQSPLHIVGKDIVRFHAVYWPAFLMAANLNVPYKIYAHGWWTNEGQKISKSLGNVIDPHQELAWLESLGCSSETAVDYFRYFLMREVPFGNDGDYSRQNFANRINSELANNIGNLSQRCLTMIFKNCEGKIPEIAAEKIHHVNAAAAEFCEKFYAEMNNLAYDKAIATIIEFASSVNKSFNDEAPWNLKKEGKIEEMNLSLYKAAESVRIIAILLQAFVPQSAAKILDLLNIETAKRNFDSLNDALKSGHTINEPKAVFPRI